MEINYVNLIIEPDETYHLNQEWNENPVRDFPKVLLPSQLNNSPYSFRNEKFRNRNSIE